MFWKKENQKRDRHSRMDQKTIFRWMLSYLPVLLIPLALGGILYGYSMNAVQEKAETIQYTMLEDRADALTEVFDTVGNVTVMIQGNQDVNKLANADKWGAEERYRLGEVQKLLAEYTLNNEEIDDIYLYFPSRETILGTASAFSSQSEMLLESRLGVSQDEMYKLLSADLYRSFHIVEEKRLLYTSVYKKNIHFLKQPVIVMVYLSDEHLDYLLHTSEVDFFLTDLIGHRYSGLSYNEVVTGVSMEEALSLSFKEGPMQWIGTTCVYQDQIEGYPLLLYSIQPDVGYVSALRGMQIMLFLYVIVCLLTGVLLVWYQTRRNYRPVDEMLSVIRRHGYLSGRELSEAGRSLEALIETFENRKDEVDRQEQVILSHALHQLFEPDGNEMSQGDRATYGMFCHFLGDQDVRQVVQFRVEGEEETGLDANLMSFMLQNVLEEELEGKVRFVFGELGGGYYLLGGSRPDTENAVTEEEMERVSRFFIEQCGIDVSIQVSGIHEGWRGIQIAYDEICALEEYRSFLTGYPKVVYYQQLKQESVLQEIYQIFELERKIRVELRAHQADVAEKDLASYRRLLESETMRTWRGVETETQEQEEATRRVADQVQEYIDANYTDKQLTVGALAEMFEVSTPWLSRNFKKEKDCGVLEYIGQVRMEKAKELLCSGLTVTETAERVGYYSSRPLIRLFTEKVGMTPMKYVKSQMKESD